MLLKTEFSLNQVNRFWILDFGFWILENGIDPTDKSACSVPCSE
ncbi:hypothetical protein NIES4106_07370 [Fischerella sp. NIES-4106]|nr:hypothetical protein NIES4106_07370 [Fischerella sp. NIES-4106]